MGKTGSQMGPPECSKNRNKTTEEHQKVKTRGHTGVRWRSDGGGAESQGRKASVVA